MQYFVKSIQIQNRNIQHVLFAISKIYEYLIDNSSQNLSHDMKNKHVQPIRSVIRIFRYGFNLSGP